MPVVDTLEVGVDADRPERFESDGRLMLQAANTERLQVVADVLAKSVVLDHYEQRVADAFDQVEPIAVDLQRFGSSRRRGRALLAHIGTTLLIQHMMVGRAEILESPEILWEHPEFERLYLRLRDEYDLRERQMAIERKLEVISRTAETELELLQNKRSLRVEWYIVILIVVEIVIMLYYEIFPHL
ncbi:MAG: hypothetical protein GWO02_01435 [Gammaproteobacteria bacterium]|nr:hypothetical protein [Gammaproteobacteria bacterium]